MIIAFWICLFIVFYTFVGYAILLYILVRIRRLFVRSVTNPTPDILPTLTIIVAAYNEAYTIEQKVINTVALTYPPEKINYVFIADGSTDATKEIIARYSQIKLMYAPERKGKISAIHRAIKEIKSEIVVFTDANTLLNKNALLNIARHYSNKKTGAVSGEKRIKMDEYADATTGEGIYWKYESLLKKWDSELYSVVGAAGELFSIRTSLYEFVPDDSILDDFMISMMVAKKGYRIAYEPNAYATEESSANVKEELKRKIRIASGGIQSALRLGFLLNPFRLPVLTFQYISHRLLRWTIAPFALIAVFVLNLLIVLQYQSPLYTVLMLGQILFYIAALVGWIFANKPLGLKMLFMPYYFCLMNYAVLAGLLRYFSGKQSVVWEKAVRKN